MAIVVATLDVLLRADGSSLRRGLQEAENDIDRFSRRVSDKVKQVGRIMTAGLTLPIIGGFGLAVKSAVSFEDAFAGVRKTTEATEAQFATLSQQLRNMATDADRPVSSLKNAQIELAKIAEIAGQLGVPIQNIAEFTEVMGELALSTDISAEEGALKLAQFINITDATQDDVGKLADVLIRLGNNMATTESQILLTAQRMAAAGTIANISAEDLLGFASAVAELGQTSSVGGTSMTKAFSEVIESVGLGGAGLEALARVSRLTADEFVQAYGEDATSAINTFIGGLSQLDPTEQLRALEDLTITGSRQRQVMLGLGQAADRLDFALGEVSDEMASGNAAYIEASKRAATTASHMNLLRNTLREVGITIGNILLPVVNEIVGGLIGFFNTVRNLNPELLKMGIVVAGIVASIGPLLFIIGSLLNPIGLLVVGIGAVVAGMGGFAAVGDRIKAALPPDVVTAINNVAGALGEFANILFPENAPTFDVNEVFGFDQGVNVEIPSFTFSLPSGSNLNEAFANSPELQRMFGSSEEFVKAFLEQFDHLTTTTIPADMEFTVDGDAITTNINSDDVLRAFDNEWDMIAPPVATSFGERLALAFEAVKPQLTEAGRVIGGAILTGLSKLASALPGFLLNTVLPAVIDASMQLGRRIGKFILGGLKDKIQESGGLIGLADDFLLAFGVAFLVSSGFRKIALVIISKIAGAIAASSLGVALAPTATILVGALTTAIVGVMALAGGAAIGAAIFLYFTNDTVKNQINRAGEEIIDTLFGEGATQKARDNIQAFFDRGLTPFIITLGKAFKNTNISEFVGDIEGLNVVFGGFSDAVTSLRDGDILGIFGGLITAIIGLGIAIITFPLDVFGLFFDKLADLTGLEFLDVLGQWLRDADAALISLGNTVARWAEKVGILDTISQAFNYMAGAIMSVVRAIGRATGLSLPFGLGGGGGGMSNQERFDAEAAIAAEGGTSTHGPPVNPPNVPTQLPNPPGSAMGGFIQANRMSLVGERGPELFVPNTGGRVIPNHQLGGGGGGLTINNLTLIGQSPTEALQMLERAANDQGL